jgi:hypothetical protein
VRDADASNGHGQAAAHTKMLYADMLSQGMGVGIIY